MILQTTLSLAAAAAMINLWLALRTVQRRSAIRALHGDGGDGLLLRRMRAQANFVENTPFVLILIGAIELSGRGGAGAWRSLARSTCSRASRTRSGWIMGKRISCG